MSFTRQIFKKNFPIVLILLSAIFSGAISLAFDSSEPTENSEMVYCPLTNRLQPVRANRQKAIKNPLDEFCGNETEKTRFSNEIVKRINLGFSITNEKQLETLFFDYFRDGKSAFDENPYFPEYPENNLVKNSLSPSGLGNNFNTQIVWKMEEKFSFQLKPRPPTTVSQIHFELTLSKKLSAISRNINPRSPPVLSA